MNTHWERATGDSKQPESVREIINKGQSESRMLVQQIYREQIEDGVRSKIARLMNRSRDPWDSVEESTRSTHDSGSP